MLKNNFLLNNVRLKEKSIGFYIKYPFVKFLIWLGFQHIDYSYIHGNREKLMIGENVSTMNTFFNLISGYIKIGDNTLLGHNCMILTGTHKFQNGRLCSLNIPPVDEVPNFGRDIIIGCGCFIGSGAIILGNVVIGDNVIIGAGSVVTSDLPSNCFAAGIPAKVINYHK